MLKLSLKPGQQISIGDDIRVIYRRADAKGIKIVLDVPKNIPISRKGMRGDIPEKEYRKESWSGKKK